MHILKEHYRLHEDEQNPVSTIDRTNPLFSCSNKYAAIAHIGGTAQAWR